MAGPEVVCRYTPGPANGSVSLAFGWARHIRLDLHVALEVIRTGAEAGTQELQSIVCPILAGLLLYETRGLPIDNYRPTLEGP
jgi:hypothetical protein